MKRILLGIALAAGLNSLAAADAVSDYIQRKKVVVNTAKAELCFADDGQCHPVLIGKTTPKGKFNMTPMMTSKPGYGGEVDRLQRRKMTFCLRYIGYGRSSHKKDAWNASSPLMWPTAS